MSSSRLLYTYILICLILVCSLSPVYAQPPAPKSGEAVAETAPIPPPIQWPRSHNYDMEHIKLNLAFDWDKEMVIGEATLRLHAFTDGLKEIALDADHFEVEAVTLANGQALNCQTTTEELVIKLDRDYKANESLSLTIKYRVQPKQGLTFIKPTANEPLKPYQIWSQGESHTNHCWFPCYDAPNDRATSEIIATVASKYQVISNGELIETQQHQAEGTTTYHWRMDTPFPSYLVSIVVGEYREIKQEADGIPVNHYVYKDQERDAPASFASVPQMIKFYAQRLGHPYPFKKYAEIMAYDFGGGMENITATTMSDTSVRDHRALIDYDDTLSAHELAHEWFGDLITCRDWSDLWLNEGFASFMTSAWLEHAHGDQEYLEDMMRAREQVLQGYKNNGGRPVSTRYFDDSESLFDENSYARPKVILNMLRQILGEKAFWQALHHYIETNRGRGLVTTADLARAIEESSGQNLDWFFDQWIYKMGQPDLLVESKYNEKTHQVDIKVKQQQQADKTQPWFEVASVFRLPLEIAVTTPAGTKIFPVTINQREQEFHLPVANTPLFINFDRGDHILKNIVYVRPSSELIAQLAHDEDVSGRVRAAKALLQYVSPNVVTALAQAAQTDNSALVRLTATQTLASFSGLEVRAALITASEDKDWQVRQAAIQGLTRFVDAKLALLFQRVIAQDPSYKVVSSAIYALAAVGSKESTDILINLVGQTSWQDTIARSALGALNSNKDSRILPLALEYASPKYSRELRAQAVVLLGTHGQDSEAALTLIKSALNSRSGILPFAALSALGNINSPAVVGVLEEYIKTPNLGEGIQRYAQSILNSVKEKKAKGQSSKEQDTSKEDSRKKQDTGQSD